MTYHTCSKARLRWRVPMVVVPAIPTARMLKAAASALSPGKRPTEAWVPVKDKHAIRYQAMLAAAPDPQLIMPHRGNQ